MSPRDRRLRRVSSVVVAPVCRGLTGASESLSPLRSVSPSHPVLRVRCVTEVSWGPSGRFVLRVTRLGSTPESSLRRGTRLLSRNGCVVPQTYVPLNRPSPSSSYSVRKDVNSLLSDLSLFQPPCLGSNCL